MSQLTGGGSVVDGETVLDRWSGGRLCGGRGTVGGCFGIGERQHVVDDVQGGGGGEKREHPPAQVRVHVRVTLDHGEGDCVAERERDVFAGRVLRGQAGHQRDAAGHGERNQRHQRYEAQQLRAQAVEEQPAGQVVRGDHQTGGQYAGGRQHGDGLPAVHGGAHDAADHEERGQHDGYEVRVEHADPRVAHQLRGVRDQHQRPGQLLEHQVQAERQERSVHVRSVDVPEERRAGGRDRGAGAGGGQP